MRTVKDSGDLRSQEWAETCARLFTAVVTRWTFVRQMHRDDPSCRAAVARLNARRVAQGLAPCSPRTGGYGKARQRRPATRLPHLVPRRGHRLQPQTPTAWHWHGRAVKSVDGSGVARPDTAANQPESPQPGSQQPGRGFPVARLVVVLSLAWGAVWAAAVGRIKGQQTSESMRFHGLQAHRERADVVLADRFSCSSWEVALVRGRGIAIVMRWPQRRQVDFRCGRRLGREDPVVSWPKPKRPAWMDDTTSAGWPATIDRRDLRVCVPQRGCRTRVVCVATTFLDAKVFAKEAIAGRYRARWPAELDLRSSTQTMPMDGRRGKTPALVRKEIWGHLLVSNLLRAAMAQAALGRRVGPRQVSWQGARQTRTAFHRQLAQASPSRREGIIQMVLSAIARPRVATRPDRYEPRACKRRPKPYPLLRVPRQQARARLATAA